MSMRQSEEWFERHVKKAGKGYVENGKRIEPAQSQPAAQQKKAAKPGGGTTRKNPGQLITEIDQPNPFTDDYAPPLGNRKKNKTERRFEVDFLIPKKLGGEIERYRFERIKLVLGDGTTYLPDFSCKWANGVHQIIEVKGGYIHEDGKVKFNCAAEQFPEFAFMLVQWKGGEWRTLKRVRC